MNRISQMREFEGKVALVTGAGQGMGRAVSERLASGGARIVVNDVHPNAAAGTTAALLARGEEAVAIAGDVSSSNDVSRMVEKTLDRFGSLDILVNNAGVLRPTAVIDIEEEEWDWVLNVNLKGTYLCSRAVLQGMRERGFDILPGNHPIVPIMFGDAARAGTMAEKMLESFREFPPPEPAG